MHIAKAFFVLITVVLGQIVAAGSALALVQTYTVNSDADTADQIPGDGICRINAFIDYCTLHAAIEEANLDGVDSVINFSAPMAISYPSLPALTENGTTIDASSQWNGTWPAGRPGVTIIGSGYTDYQLNIQANLATVLGIEFVNGNAVQVKISGSSSQSTIGGSGTGERNVFHGGTGVMVQSSGAGTIITNNYFGTLDGLTKIPGDRGILVKFSTGTIIEQNLIGGHTFAGIYIWGGATNFIRNGNIIGANRQKNAAMGNAIGIKMDESSYNLVQNNHIYGNSSHGVELWRASNNTVIQNSIGDQWSSLGNDGHGIHVDLTSNNNILGKNSAGNTIVNNGGHGVLVKSSNDNLIQGNNIGNNTLDGVQINEGINNKIGGAGTLGNGITSNNGSGVHLTGILTTGNTVSGNDIGMSEDGFDYGNKSHGVLIDAGSSSNLIGGLGANDGNRIGWNNSSGIYIEGAATLGNVVAGNLIGAPSHWKWQAPNGQHGIALFGGAHNNWIGIGNTVVANGRNGITISNSNDNIVWFNFIGTNAKQFKWGNDGPGVAIANSAGNTISLNHIAYNGTSSGEAGVYVFAGSGGNPITVNSIHDNGGVGIELYNGGNGGLAAPVITDATCQGPVAGTACPGCTVEIFSDSADEGRLYEGTTTANLITGFFSWSGKLNGPNITATTTSGANTSQFSTPVGVGDCGCTFSVLPLSNSKAVVICL